jgi:hypothetical protein
LRSVKDNYPITRRENAALDWEIGAAS